MSLAIGLLVIVVFAVYAGYELFGSRLKLMIKSFMPMIRVAVVGFVIILLLYLYCTNTSMFMTLIETIAPEPITRAMNAINATNDTTPDVAVEQPARIKRSVSAAKKKRVAAAQKWKCDICGETLDETYEIDHETALCNGGTNDDSNLRALCRPCHAKKTAEERRS